MSDYSVTTKTRYTLTRRTAGGDEVVGEYDTAAEAWAMSDKLRAAEAAPGVNPGERWRGMPHSVAAVER